MCKNNCKKTYYYNYWLNYELSTYTLLILFLGDFRTVCPNSTYYFAHSLYTFAYILH